MKVRHFKHRRPTRRRIRIDRFVRIVCGAHSLAPVPRGPINFGLTLRGDAATVVICDDFEQFDQFFGTAPSEIERAEAFFAKSLPGTPRETL